MADSELIADAQEETRQATTRALSRRAGRGASKKASEEFSRLFLLLFGLASAVLASSIAAVYRMPDEAADALTFTAEEAQAIGSPILRLLMRARKVQQLSRLASGKGDWILLGEALLMYGQRVAGVIETYKTDQKEPTSHAPRASFRERFTRRGRPPRQPASQPGNNGHAAVPGVYIPVHGDAFGPFE